MALIPPEAGIRMRMQTESSLVQPLAPVKGIPAELPDLQIGQAFTARIQEALPDNTYRALVAGRQLTLQLPEGAAAGDTLELVLVDRTPKTLIAQRADGTAPPPAANQPYPYSKISDAGKMIGQLLLPEGESPQPAPLNRGQPLLQLPPATAGDLAPTLAKAVSESGLFYEAHQAQWIAGQRPIDSLRAEPQGQLPPTAANRAAPTGNQNPAAAVTPLLEGKTDLVYTMRPQAAAGQATVGQATSSEGGLGPPQSAAGQTQAATSGATQNSPTNHTVPDEVRPLVQQQLDAVATQRLNWHGEVWPGQVMDWEIERDRTEERNAAASIDEPARWNTTLRLTMPQLGTVDATLQLAGNRLRLRIGSSGDAATVALRQQAPALAQALSDAGIALQSIDIRHEA
jgi:hypothetical protein